MGTLDSKRLLGRWVHSHEEDAESGLVFRSPEHPFPPSRGREAWELRADGTLGIRRPGAADVPEEIEGTWALEGAELVLYEEGAAERRLTVVEAGEGRLVLRP